MQVEIKRSQKGILKVLQSWFVLIYVQILGIIYFCLVFIKFFKEDFLLVVIVFLLRLIMSAVSIVFFLFKKVYIDNFRDRKC